ncbi:MAG: hypothetical protein EPO68_02280 [Planctomycetota bacterium]|nr:MAG: hypothetical protein EPO68_02280 [Planctomycetota bacterium]
MSELTRQRGVGLAQLDDTLQKLCAASRNRYVNPYEELEWPDRVEPGQWFTSPELISLYGTPAWERMDERARARLSFLEAVNFYSINVNGERALIEGLAKRMYAAADPVLEICTPYLQHLVDEENKHIVYFGGFCRRYANGIYGDRKLDFGRNYAPGEDDFLFFARVLIFEELVDVHNQRMAHDARLAPIARRINLLHHLEEGRHLAFGRLIAAELFERHARNWTSRTLESVRAYLAAYLVATWREYTNPDVYADAGLARSYELAEEVFAHPSCRAHRRAVSAGCVGYLLEHGMLAREPEL